MANACYYEIHAKGSKYNVQAFMDYITPSVDHFPEVILEKGTDSEYVLWFKGDCKWELDAYTEEKPDFVYDESIDEEDYYKELQFLTLRQKSEIFQIEFFAVEVDEGGEFVAYLHYKNGKKICNVDLSGVFQGEDEDDYDEEDYEEEDDEEEERVSLEERKRLYNEMIAEFPEMPG